MCKEQDVPVSHCYCVKGSSTGVATWQCALPCSASGGAAVMKCGWFSCTQMQAILQKLSIIHCQYSAITV